MDGKVPRSRVRLSTSALGQLRRKGHGTSSANSLLLLATEQALETLLLSGVLTLVLEEDGTAVESEDFFQLLEDDTCLMVLESGQSWSPSRVRGWYWGRYRLLILYISPKPLLLPTLDLWGRGRERCVVKDNL